MGRPIKYKTETERRLRRNELARARRAANPEKWRKISRDKSRKYKTVDPQRYRDNHRKYRGNNPDAIRNRGLVYKFGITLDDFNDLLVKQNGVCAVCLEGRDTQKHDFSVDHCHSTGRVRGILCSRCNTALGLLKESITRIEALKNYVLRS